MIKHQRLLLSIVCILILALMAGCKDAPDQPAETELSQLTYTLLLQTENKAPVKDIKVFVYEDASLSEMLCVGDTDEQGKVSFMAEASDRYVAVLKETPAGYEVEPHYALTSAETVITLSSRQLTEEEMENHRYVLGDKMNDFIVTDCDGQTYSLMELLENKKAVVLNFWFINCGPCKMEFPYLQEAYVKYEDRVAFLAMNPVDGTDHSVRKFKEDASLTFPMAVCDEKWQNLMGLSAYPTTVIIDRDGYISLIHEGMFTDSQMLCNALDYFAADEYQREVFGGIEEIPSMSVN